MQIEIATSTPAFEALRPGWEQLEDEAASDTQFFQCFAWNWHWWCCVGDTGRRKLRILTLRDEQGLLLVWPMVIERETLWRVLRPLGGELTQYADALVHPRARAGHASVAVQMAATALANLRGADVMVMPRTRDDAAVSAVMAACGASAPWCTAAIHVDCGIETDYDSWLARRGKKMRQNQRRSAKAMHALGVTTMVADEREVDIDQFLDTSLEFKRAWLERHGLSGKALEQASTRAFLAALCAELKLRNGLKLSTIHLDGKLVATGLAFHYKQRYYYYLGAFDPTVEHTGPGRLQMENALRWCFDNGVRYYDMLPPDTAFKHLWSDASTTVSSWMQPLNARGALYTRTWHTQLRPRAKNLYANLPGGLRRWIGASAARAG